MNGLRHGLVALFMAAAMVLGGAAAWAADLSEPLEKFLTDDFGDTADGIMAVAASGDPRAQTIIEALANGKLAYSAESKKVFYKDAADKLIDALTGQPAAGDPPADLETVRLNNRIRRTIDAALGSLTLMASDPRKRLVAAQAVFKSRDAGSLEALEAAIEKETSASIKKAMNEARAAIILNKDEASETDKLDAIAVIRQRADQDSMALLGGLPSDSPASVLKAAKDAMASMQSSLAVWSALQNAWYGISLGSVLLLAAIGLAITFGVMGVINMAHGEMVMIGA